MQRASLLKHHTILSMTECVEGKRSQRILVILIKLYALFDKLYESHSYGMTFLQNIKTP